MSGLFNGFGLKKVDENVVLKRQIYVGGSDMPAILGISKYKSQFELAKEKVGIEEKQYTCNVYTTYGNKLESQIRDYINTVNQMSFIVNTYVDEARSIRCNVDGIDLETMTLLEIKTHGRSPDIKSYEAQMQLYMVQTGCDMGWLAMYERPEDFDIEFNPDRLQIKEVPANPEYQAKLLDSIETFWIRCEYLKDNPKMDETEFLTKGTSMDVVLAKLNQLAPELAKYKKVVKYYEAQESELKEILYEKMEENDIKKIDAFSVIATRVFPSTSRRFDSTRFKKEHADLYGEYLTESMRKGYVKLTFKEEQ